MDFNLDEIVKDLPEINWEAIIGMVGDGFMIELGVYAGASFYEICKYAYPRKVYGFDWFEGLPEEWGQKGSKGAASLGGKPPACPENGEFIVGLVQATLPKFIERIDSIAFVHFDLDLYSSTKCGLQLLSSFFKSGTILAFDEIDDRGDQYGRNALHEQKAFREWLRETSFGIEMLGRRHEESWVLRLI
jgi:hypothetical protein